jgi:NTP pyrophosphatase (non-canonical NTP hydrolase)
MSGHLSLREAELLEMLAEEAAEVVQAAMKVLRHGWDSRNPMRPDSFTNMEHLSRELGQLAVLVNQLPRLSEEMHEFGRVEKEKSLSEWTHHQPGSVLAT